MQLETGSFRGTEGKDSSESMAHLTKMIGSMLESLENTWREYREQTDSAEIDKNNFYDRWKEAHKSDFEKIGPVWSTLGEDMLKSQLSRLG